MKERIYKAAIEEFKEKGIKFTMSDLARNLGVSKRTLYEQFQSKDDLIGYIIQQVMDEIKQQEQAIYHDPQMTIAEKLKAILALLPQDFQYSFTRLVSEVRRYHPEQWKHIDRCMEEEWGCRTGFDRARDCRWRFARDTYSHLVAVAQRCG
jgi:AcrR family transcriptional regulator